MRVEKSEKIKSAQNDNRRLLLFAGTESPIKSYDLLFIRGNEIQVHRFISPDLK